MCVKYLMLSLGQDLLSHAQKTHLTQHNVSIFPRQETNINNNIVITNNIAGLLVLNHLVAVSECQEGYDYAPPPADVQLRPQGGGASKPQADHGHHDSSDPLAWLRESVPGTG